MAKTTVVTSNEEVTQVLRRPALRLLTELCRVTPSSETITDALELSRACAFRRKAATNLHDRLLTALRTGDLHIVAQRALNQSKVVEHALVVLLLKEFEAELRRNLKTATAAVLMTMIEALEKGALTVVR